MGSQPSASAGGPNLGCGDHRLSALDDSPAPGYRPCSEAADMYYNLTPGPRCPQFLYGASEHRGHAGRTYPPWGHQPAAAVLLVRECAGRGHDPDGASPVLLPQVGAGRRLTAVADGRAAAPGQAGLGRDRGRFRQAAVLTGRPRTADSCQSLAGGRSALERPAPGGG